MNLQEIIEHCVPAERGIVTAYIRQRRDADYMVDRTTFVPDVIGILKKHYCQIPITVNANGHNPIGVEFEKYVISRPKHGNDFNWGNHYEALLELCSTYVVNLWKGDDIGYELAADGSVARSWESQGGF